MNLHESEIRVNLIPLVESFKVGKEITLRKIPRKNEFKVFKINHNINYVPHTIDIIQSDAL